MVSNAIVIMKVCLEIDLVSQWVPCYNSTTEYNLKSAEKDLIQTGTMHNLPWLAKGIDHATVCAGVFGTAIGHNTRCAGCCAATGGRAGRHNSGCAG